jgi:hypothetical protein
MERIGNPGMAMPLSIVEVAYNIVQQASTNPDPAPPQELYPILEPILSQDSLATYDPLDLVLPSDEVILEEMIGPDRSWDDLHHIYYFLHELKRIEAGEFIMIMNGDVPFTVNPLATHKIYAEGNMESIAETIPINICRTLSVVENIFIRADCSPEEIQIYTELFKYFCDVFAWSYEEMSGIDPHIVEHEITSYLDVNHVQQDILPFNPHKEVTIEAEVEKLIKVGFIYLVQLTKWVSNLVRVNKKKGTIHVCMEFHDLNKACLKVNFPTPFIDHIVDECARFEVFSFMDGFFGYNQIQIKTKDQHKTKFICHWGTFAYRKMPFGLKNVGAITHQAMSFSFHDLKNIVKAYIDDLASCSHNRFDHPSHLRLIFERCIYYHIRLNPNKCSFCVKT